MNKWFTVFCLMLMSLSTVFLHSQPKVAYILPDIGAPSMNVYVEFVSNYNQTGNFGADGLYLNNPGDNVRVTTVNSADESKVKIGPVVVSWEGRLISTHIFVHPDLYPNSTDALILNPEFKIPLIVTVNGQVSNVQMFYIVRPRPYFDGSANPTELVFGEGALGLRSPRGAMIFDSIKLDNKIYTISQTDCDPNTDGNQGYLPFTLIVNGKLTGMGSSSTISADAIGKNGGPGGGGGGGRYYDAFLFGGGNNGDDGGAGFVGGGAGGRNRNAMVGISDAHKSPGVGTGTGSYSLNGVPFPVNQAYESAAGGTGHPFGLSGQSCANGNDCEPNGAYGAGSGIYQNRQGGSAGYANNGTGIGATYGLAHGNVMNIPLAGGSGGASGNPNFPDAYSGNGGGGGGAMTICAHEISSVKFTAKGANGGSPNGGIGNESFGGSGSGGALNIMSKIKIQDVTINVDGGVANNRRAGKGRLRLDGKIISNSAVIETDDNSFVSEPYIGISTDTSKYVTGTFEFTGTQALPGKNISSTFYLAQFNGDWIELSGLGFTDPPNGEWLIYVNLPTQRPISCFVAMQNVPNPQLDEYIHEPIRIMSQAAANLYILDINPILVADSIAENMAITCIGYERFIETTIKNDETAGGNLEFNLSNNNWIFGNNGFEILEPLGDVVIEPGDSIILKVKYQYTGGSKVDIINRLYFNHNDPSQNTPWVIEFRVGDAYQPRMEYIGLAEDFIFPDTRIGGKNSRNFLLKNLGESDLRIESINPINPPFYVMGTDKALPVILKPGDELRVLVEFRPTDEGEATAALSTLSIVTDTTCAWFAFQPISGKGVFSEIDLSTNEIDFGLVPWCENRQEIISIRNPASATTSFTLTSLAVIEGDNPEAFIITNPKNPPITITPDNGTQFNISINGKLAGNGNKRAVFRIETDVPEYPVIEVILKAEIIGFNVTPSQSPVNLGNVEVGFDINSSVTLRNTGRLPERLLSVTANNPGFTLPTVMGDVIDPNTGIYTFNFMLNTNNQPLNNELTIAFDDPCPDTIKIPITLNYVYAKESAFCDTQKLLSNPSLIDTIDFGKFSPCEEGLLKLIQFENNSDGRYIVLDESVMNLDISAFSAVGSGLSYPDTIVPSPNSKGGLQIYFDPTDVDAGIYHAKYNVELYINGEIVSRTIILKAEVIEGDIEFISQFISFSEVIGLSIDKELIIRNNGPYPVEIIGFTLPGNNVFNVVGNYLGIVINPESELKFMVNFKPENIHYYQDSIVVKLLIAGCEREFTFYLNGEGKPSKKLKIQIPHLVVEPTFNNYNIPIYGKLDKIDDTLEDFKVETIKVTMHRSVFYPKEIIGGTLISSILVGDFRELVFSIDNIKINNNDSLIAQINGSTLLGEVDYSDIIISDITNNRPELVSEITSENGSMTTEICEDGGDRLLKISDTGSFIEVNPNPSSETMSMTLASIEKGSHKVTITDIMGNEVELTNWTNSNSGDNLRKEVISLDKFSSGNYILKLYTPTEIITKNIVIIK